MPEKFAAQVKLEDGAVKSLLRRASQRVSGRGAGAPRIRRVVARRDRRADGSRRRRSQAVLRAESEAVREGGRAPGEPHPDYGRCQGDRGRKAGGAREGRAVVKAGAAEPGEFCRSCREKFAGPGLRGERRRPRVFPARRDGQAVRRCGVPDEGGRNRGPRRVAVRLSHHPAHRRERARV